MSLETSDRRNPFAGCGRVLSKGRLIGRDAHMREIYQRVIKNERSVSIIGMPCIGKSSLIQAVLWDQRHNLQDQGIIPILITLTMHDRNSAASFFRMLVKECQKELEKIGWLTNPTKDAARVALENEEYDFGDVKTFFQEVSLDKIRVVFVLDKFDYASTIFHDNVELFQGLEVLSGQPNYAVTFITLSFRPLNEIAPHMKAISLFYKTLLPHHYLTPFSDPEMEAYFQLLASVSVQSSDQLVQFPVTDALKEKIDLYCGRHPYLLELLGYELVETFLQTGKEVDVDIAVLNTRDVFINYVKYLKEELSAYGLLSKLFRVVVGPPVNITPDEEQDLLLYGLIKPNLNKMPNENGVVPDYLAFCHHLQTYLNFVDLDDDMMSLWTKTEQTLRCAIADLLEKAYGSHWFEELEKRYPDISKRSTKTAEGIKTTTLYDRCRAKAREALDFRITKPTQNPLEHTQTRELFDIIFYKKWNDPSPSLWTAIFQATFQTNRRKKLAYWRDCADFLSDFRNPVCHSLANRLYDDDIATMRKYCREILEVLNKYIPK